MILMRNPYFERRERLQEEYRTAVYQLALADETDDEPRKRMARRQVKDAVQGLRSIGINPIRGR
ncbi:hypothetical protein ACIRPX_16055 [Streptomyces sp. NPDC101225]|uniref:hypothetical protein n=1 Tax=Streptomyces sp. NPDC101225 TaxID=3366135 RepID=UPI003806BF7B